MNTAALAALMFEAGRAARWTRGDCLSRWPASSHALQKAGLLKMIDVASAVYCADCGEDHELKDAEKPTAWCPLVGAVEIRRDQVEMLVFDPGAWVSQIGDALQLGPPIECVPDALWKFGLPQKAGWRKEIWLARDLASGATFDAVARYMRSFGGRRRFLLTGSDIALESGPSFDAQIIRLADCSTLDATGKLWIALEQVPGARKKKGSRGAGRTRKVDPAIALFQERAGQGITVRPLAEEARQIEQTLQNRMSAADCPSPRTIEDAIRDEYARVTGRHRAVKPR